MSKHLLNSLKFSCGIVSIYCLSLAIVPTADAQTASPPPSLSNVTGVNVASPVVGPSLAPASISVSRGGVSNVGSTNVGGTVATGGINGSSGVTGDKSNQTFGRNRQAIVSNTQAVRSRLEAAQIASDSASARVSQLLAQSPSTPSTTPDNSKLSAVRFALKPMSSTEAGACGCNNPDVVVKPTDNSGAELAAAKEAQAQATEELAAAQAQARQLLAAAKAAEAEDRNAASNTIW
jgi:hypothetical protein